MAKILRTLFLVCGMLFLFGSTVSALNVSKDVWVTEDGKTTTYKTLASTVGEFLDKEGIEIGPNDVLTLSVGDAILVV